MSKKILMQVLVDADDARAFLEIWAQFLAAKLEAQLEDAQDSMDELGEEIDEILKGKKL